MITEDQLRSALHRAGDELTPPDDATAGILDAALGHATRFAEDASAPNGSISSMHARRPSGRVLTSAVAGVVILAAIGIAIGLHSSTPNQINKVTVPPLHRFGAALPVSKGAASNAVGGTATPTVLPNQPVRTPNSSGGVPAKVAYTGRLTLSISSSQLASDVAALRDLASRTGGYVATTNVSEAAHSRGGTMSLAIPAGAFTGAVSSAEGLGSVSSVVTNATDLTTRYSDTTAQIQALTDVRAQLENLLSRAAKVSDLLAVEEQIQNVQSQIDELESTERSLDNEVTYATLAVKLQVRAPKHHVSTPSALSRAWTDAITGFTGGLKWLLSISGALLFALILAGLGALGIRAFLRRGLPRLRRFFL